MFLCGASGRGVRRHVRSPSCMKETSSPVIYAFVFIPRSVVCLLSITSPHSVEAKIAYSKELTGAATKPQHPLWQGRQEKAAARKNGPRQAAHWSDVCGG